MKTHYLDYKELGKTKRKFLTAREAEIVNSAWNQSGGRSISLKSPDGVIDESIPKRDIERIGRLSSSDKKYTSWSGMFAICDYGTRHPHLGDEGFQECTCKDRFYGFYAFEFRRILKNLYPKVLFNTDITPEMQASVKNLILKCRDGE